MAMPREAIRCEMRVGEAKEVRARAINDCRVARDFLSFSFSRRRSFTKHRASTCLLFPSSLSLLEYTLTRSSYEHRGDAGHIRAKANERSFNPFVGTAATRGCIRVGTPGRASVRGYRLRR